jgi:tetratricopeptide (TPR) repeat protein
LATYDVFIASAPEDGPWVRRLAAGLKALDIDVFLDELHVVPGEVVIHRIEEALLSSATAVLVCSRTSMQARLVREEYAAMVTRVDDGVQRLIPVVLHDVVLTPLLASRGVIDFREAASGPLFDAKVVELARAIVHGRQAPDWLTLSPEAIRDRFVVRGPRSAHLVADGDSVTLEVDGQTTSSPHRFDPDRLSDLLWSLDQARDNAAVYRGTQSSVAAESSADVALNRIGTYLGETFLAGAIGEALRAEIDTAKARGATLRLGVLTRGGLPATLPWEMAIPPGSAEPLGLDPEIEIYRETVDAEPPPVAQVPAPLRVLAALAAPDDDNLDLEDEQRRLHDAFESPRRGAGVHVRVLDEGTLTGIREALSGQEFHILHLACHARPGLLRLESENGTAADVNAAAFVAALPPNRRPPLVVLSGCSTALDDDDLHGLARALITAGVPQVLAMTAAVTDMFAREFCELFYRELALAQRPEALPALAAARQLTERRRAAGTMPEWATPVLFLRGTSFPLYTLAEQEALERLATVADPYLGPDIPLRAVGGFVGRRSDLRVLVSAFCAGRGVLIHGIGGVGKSSLAAELLRRLRADAGLIVAVVGRADPDTVLTVVADGLFAAAVRAREDESSVFRRLAAELRLTSRPWRQRLDALVRILFPATRITLLLDNADVNATIQPSGSANLDDPDLAELLGAWVTAPGDSRLVLTSRTPIVLDGLHLHHLGPLSFNETRRLIWRLPALAALHEEDQLRAYLNVGGHPRTLEILDALLRRGATDFAGVRQRTEELLRQRGVGDPRRWMVEIGDAGLDTALAEAIALTTHDSLLENLLGLVTRDDLEVLVSLSVCEAPADLYLIKAMLIDDGGAALIERFSDLTQWMGARLETEGRIPDEPPGAENVDEEKVAASLQRMTRLGLVAQRVILLTSYGLPAVEGVDRGTYYSMHPWTAERVRSLHPHLAAVAHRRLAYNFVFRSMKMTQVGRSLGDAKYGERGHITYLVMARRHAHAAGDIDFAILVLYMVNESLMTMGEYDLLERLYKETYGWTADDLSKPRSANRINVLVGLSQISVGRGRHSEAESYARQALELLPVGDDRRASALHQLGESYLSVGQNDRAAATFRSVIDLMANNEETAKQLSSLGLAYYGLGKAEEDRNLDIAEPMLRHALELFERAGDRYDAAKAKHSLGNTAGSRGDLETASRLYHEALEVFLEVGDRTCTVRCYGGLGEVARRQRQLRAALDYQRRALALAEQIGDGDGIQRARSQIAELMQERGSRDLEVDNRRRALNLALDAGNVDDARRQFMKLAETLGELDDQAELSALVDEGRKYFERAGDIFGLIWAYTWTGQLEQDAGNAAKAKSSYLRALSRAREANANVETVVDLLVRLGLLTERENTGQAVDFYKSALDLAAAEMTDDSRVQLGDRIVNLTIHLALTELNGPRIIAQPQQLVSVYADLAVNLAHLPGQERAAMIHRMATCFLASGFGLREQDEWQRLLLAADVYRVGRNTVPANRNDFVAALESVSGDRYGAMFRLPQSEGAADTKYEALLDGIGASIADLLPPHIGIKWMPFVNAAVAAIVMVSEGRSDEYEEHLWPMLEKQANDQRSRRTVTAMKHRIAGEEWRPPLPCDLTYLIITLLEQQLASFLETRAERDEEPAEDDRGD